MAVNLNHRRPGIRLSDNRKREAIREGRSSLGGGGVGVPVWSKRFQVELRAAQQRVDSLAVNCRALPGNKTLLKRLRKARRRLNEMVLEQRKLYR